MVTAGVKRCPSCGAETIPGKRFCGDCGAPLSDGPPTDRPSPRQATGSAPDEAERRQVTVMFCDLADSTALAERLDPEELRDVVRAYQEVAAHEIEARDGHVAQYLGDGLLAYFGYPIAREADAHRAVQAALAIGSGVAGLSRRLEGERRQPIAVRIGIHTGLVVIGEMGGGDRHERLAVGDTPNIAARLQALAAPGRVVVSEPTYRLIEGLIDVEPTGAHRLKGVSAPMALYTVVGESGVRSRFDLPEPPGISPLVGRAGDLETIRDAWGTVTSGHGRAIVIVAEPGIGKSRLVLAAKQALAGSSHAVLAARCSPDAQNTELFAIADLLNRIFRFDRRATPAERWDRIATVLARYRSLPPDSVALFASILGVLPPPGATATDMPPRKFRRLVFEALIAWLLEEANDRPQLLVVEDLHWADPTTIELLGLITRRIGASPILCLFTTRPESTPPWDPSPGLSHIELTHLSGPDSEALAVSVAGETVLPVAALREIVAKADGIPLFVEELTRSFTEADRLPMLDVGLVPGSRPRDLSIPSSLQGSLMARLDRLGNAKDVAQTAAVLGRDVPLDLLRAVVSLEPHELSRQLAALEEAQILYRHDAAGGPTYTFRHALIRDIAYESLLRSARQRQHRLAARILEERFPEVVETQPELIARHHRLAGEYEPAARYFQRAGMRAMARSALVEAIALFTAGIELLDSAGARGTPLELSLQLGLGGALLSSEGYVKPEVERSFSRAYELGSKLGDVPSLFPATFGLWLYDFVGGRLDQALESTRRLLEIAIQTGDRLLHVEGTLARALTLLAKGDVVGARSLFEEGLARYDPAAGRSLSRGGRIDATYLSCFAVDLWLLGLPDTAAEVGARALNLADTYDHPYTLGLVLSWLGILAQLRGDDGLARTSGLRGVAVCEANGLAFWKMGSTLDVAAADEPAQRIVSIPLALGAYHAADAHFAETHFLLRLADAHRDLGRIDDALRVLDEALTAVATTGERWFEPEVLSLKGEILAATDVARGEECLRQAIDLARRQGSRMLELRAATRLARLLLDTGRANEADTGLRPLVDTFEEGLESIDLREARNLLQHLA
jgi:class 3 adenylate cyclase/tetratricopeptide (TPR) repeat protein